MPTSKETNSRQTAAPNAVYWCSQPQLCVVQASVSTILDGLDLRCHTSQEGRGER